MHHRGNFVFHCCHKTLILLKVFVKCLILFRMRSGRKNLTLPSTHIETCLH